nr:unnamed protein product [Spirometra erinaceieuropaei]
MQNHSTVNSAFIRPGTPGDVVNLCIGGRLFITRRATLYRLPDSRLYMIATQGEEQSRAYQEEFRSPERRPQDVQHTTTSGEYTVGGATLLPNSIVSSLFGNKDLISAAAVCRNQIYSSSEENNLNTPTTPRPRETYSHGAGEYISTPQPVYFFDRDPEIFRFVLDYYRTGELHLPSNICGPFVRKELIFWGIDESLIDPCCMPAYMRYDEEKRTKKTLFRDCFEDIDSMQNLVKFSRGWKKWRYRMWLFMDHPSSSFAAKLWAMLLLLLMIASVLCYCFSTSSIFRRTAWAAKTVKSHPDYSGLYNFTQKTDDPLDICDDNINSNNPKIRRDCFTEPLPALIILDIVLNCIFSVEFILKGLLAPDKPKFLTSLVAIIDMVNLLSYWVYISIFYFHYYQQKPDSSLPGGGNVKQPPNNLWLLNILSMTQALRILRIFRISKISRGLRVLILTVKKSIPELVLLAFLLMIGMFMFSCTIYMAEYSVNDTFIDIPEAFWWSIITLTTVGYGDTYPRGTAGYVIGSIAAVSGCILTGLAIPIIGNNFNTYYMYMKNQLKEDKYLKELRKDINSTGVGNIIKGLGVFAEKTGLPMLHRKYRQFRADKQYTVGNRAATNATYNAKREELHKKAATGCRTKHNTANREGSKPNRIQRMFPASTSSDNMRKELLQNVTTEDHTPAVCREINNASVSQTKFALELAKHRESLNPVFDAGFDRRTSMVHPLATDGLLNSIPSSLVQTSGTLMLPDLDELVEVELNEVSRQHSIVAVRRSSRRLSNSESGTSPCLDIPDCLDQRAGKRCSNASISTENPNGLHFPEFAIAPTPVVMDQDAQVSPPVKAGAQEMNRFHPADAYAFGNSTGLKRNYV